MGKLSQGVDEKAQVCGWLKYKFGVTWQIAQVVLAEMSAGPDTKKSDAD
ncbi:MAG TPA: VOC family protein [Chitinophagales bacterium]|nr:VOC family protein [Chitinophagales bacterium]